MDYSLTPTRVSCKMSSSLKEKLKKLGRYHGSRNQLSNINTPNNSEIRSSPVSSCKPLSNLGSFNENNLKKLTTSTHFSPCGTMDQHLKNKSMAQSPSNFSSHSTLKDDDTEETLSHKALLERVGEWRKKEQIYEETLRKLTLVKVYQSKNNLLDLEHLIMSWRKACQKAIYDLLARSQDPKPSIGQLLKFLEIDESLVGYDQENDSFI